MADKTEEPTEQRLQEARSQGQVVKSQEIRWLIHIIVILAYFYASGPEMVQKVIQLLTLSFSALSEPFESALKEVGAAALNVLSSISLLFSAWVVFGTCLAHFGQVGFLFATSAVQPSFQRFNPAANLKRMVSLKNLVELAKTLSKLTLVGLVFFYLLRNYIMTFQFLPSLGVSSALPITSEVVDWLLKALLACTFVFALGDYSFQRFMVMKELRMTKEEVKQEFKNNEGDPEIKARRREMHQEIQSGSLSSEVKKSSVMVKNPTHIAVGIFYQRGVTPLPLITVKGRGYHAARLLELARKYEVPVLENVSLARRLFQQGQAHAPVPESLLEPVAEVIRAVIQWSHQVFEEAETEPSEGEAASSKDGTLNM